MAKADDMQDDMKKQLADLRSEMDRITRTLGERAGDVAEEASGWYEGATEQASRAARELKNRAQSVTETVQENPGTVSTALVLGGMLGFVIGMLAAQSTSNHGRRWL